MCVCMRPRAAAAMSVRSDKSLPRDPPAKNFNITCLYNVCLCVCMVEGGSGGDWGGGRNFMRIMQFARVRYVGGAKGHNFNAFKMDFLKHAAALHKRLPRSS